MSERRLTAREQAAGIWRYRFGVELDSAERFRLLESELVGLNASESLTKLAAKAVTDELRHAELCRGLVQHLGGAAPSSAAHGWRRAAPAHLGLRERAIYEIVAMACITESVSAALLGALVERARDPEVTRVLKSVLRDEVNHGRLGWAFLEEQRSRGIPDCIGSYLPAMLEGAFPRELFDAEATADPMAPELAGLGLLDRTSSRRVVRETLELVVFRGLDRFGIDTSAGRRWLEERGVLNQWDGASEGRAR